MRGSGYSVKGDPYWISARWSCSCDSRGCSAVIAKGERAFYWPKGRKIECAACGEMSDRFFQAEVADEFMSGGWSS